MTAVGGTALAVGKTNNYLFEQGWGTGKSVLTNGAWDPASPAYLYGGGGGTSRMFEQPNYQKGVVPASISQYFSSTPHRAVPDVAMVGDPNTGFLVGQSQTFPNGTIKYSEYRIGGTSLSSPLFAGLVAVADQVGQGSLGFLNPTIYKLAGTPAFHDIASTGVTDGVVRVDFVNGSTPADGKVTSLRTLNQTGVTGHPARLRRRDRPGHPECRRTDRRHPRRERPCRHDRRPRPVGRSPATMNAG